MNRIRKLEEIFNPSHQQNPQDNLNPRLSNLCKLLEILTR